MSGAVAAAGDALLRTPAGAAVRRRYDEPWRSYHAWSHPEAMLRSLTEAEADGVAIADPTVAAAFVLWHDAVYDPQAPHGRNETLSAQLCAADLPELAPSVGPAIMATIAHVADTAQVALLLDVDLSILGAAPDVFAAYDAAIAREYAHVRPKRYRAGRAAVLRRFLDRERLFLTDWAFGRWEDRARGNLVAAIERLA